MTYPNLWVSTNEQLLYSSVRISRRYESKDRKMENHSRTDEVSTLIGVIFKILGLIPQ